MHKIVNPQQTRFFDPFDSVSTEKTRKRLLNGIKRIRFVTSYPRQEFYDEILHTMADLPKVCPYIHIPAQSGPDKILAAMKRNYSAKQYLELIT